MLYFSFDSDLLIHPETLLLNEISVMYTNLSFQLFVNTLKKEEKSVLVYCNRIKISLSLAGFGFLWLFVGFGLFFFWLVFCLFCFFGVFCGFCFIFSFKSLFKIFF